MLEHGFIIDGVRWVIGQHPKRAIPLCPKDYMEIDLPDFDLDFATYELKCEKCGGIYRFSRTVDEEKIYVLRDINSRVYKGMKFINLDNEAVPVAENKVSSKDNKYFVTSRLMESKTGLRLVVYAGEKGKNEKAQVFVEPDIKRLSFDQNDLHPLDVFTKLEATFSDGTKARQSKK